MIQDRLKPYLLGGGSVETGENDQIRLTLPRNTLNYADAQLDDYHNLQRSRFPWRPPLTLRLRGRASHPDPVGTLGFGFWNDPFTLSIGQGGAARRIPASPQALWFFYGSKENELSFHPGSEPNGWKASSLFFPAIHPLIFAPLAATGFLLLRVGILRSWIIDKALQLAKASEHSLPVSLTDWHEYVIRWNPESAQFFVDDQLLLTAEHPPQGPLGFVVWIDNQFAVVSRERGVRFGVVPTGDEQWLEIADLEIVSS